MMKFDAQFKTGLSEIIDHVNKTYQAQIKRYDMHLINPTGKTLFDIINSFLDLCETLERADVRLDERVVAYFNDVAIPAYKQLKENQEVPENEEETEKDAEQEVSRPETESESGEAELGEAIEGEEWGEEAGPPEEVGTENSREVEDETVQINDGADEITRPSTQKRKPRRQVIVPKSNRERHVPVEEPPKKRKFVNTDNIDNTIAPETEEVKEKEVVERPPSRRKSRVKQQADSRRKKEPEKEDPPKRTIKRPPPRKKKNVPDMKITKETGVSMRREPLVAEEPERKKRPTEKDAGMIFIIPKATLAREVRRLKPKKASTDYNLVSFRGGKMISYDNKKALSFTLPDESMSMDFGLNAYALSEALKSISFKEITISEAEHHVMISGGRTAIKLHRHKDDFISSLYDSFDMGRIRGQFVPMPGRFIEALNVCGAAASNSADNIRLLHTVCVDSDEVWGTTGYQVARVSIGENPFGTFYLPKEITGEIVDFVPVGYFIANQWAHFINKEDTIFSVRLIIPQAGEKFVGKEASFADIKDGFSFGSGIGSKDVKNLMKFANKKPIEIKIKEDATALFTATGSLGSMTVSTQLVDYTGEPKTILVSPTLLLLLIDVNGVAVINDRTIQVSNEYSDFMVSLTAKKD